MRTSPRSGRSRPATMLSSVDLPEPDSPTIAAHSPRLTARWTSSNNGEAGPKDLASPRTSSIRGESDQVREHAEDGAREGGQASALEQPARLREHPDRDESDMDL